MQDILLRTITSGPTEISFQTPITNVEIGKTKNSEQLFE